MLTRTTTLLAAAALAATTWAVAPAQAQGPAAGSTAAHGTTEARTTEARTTAAAAAGRTYWHRTAYRRGPVAVERPADGTTDRHLLVFAGRRGDRVRLDRVLDMNSQSDRSTVHLRRLEPPRRKGAPKRLGRVVRPSVGGTWRLPRDARFVFVVRTTAGLSMQLTTVSLVAAAPLTTTLNLPVKRGTAYLVRATAPDSGATMVTLRGQAVTWRSVHNGGASSRVLGYLELYPPLDGTPTGRSVVLTAGAPPLHATGTSLENLTRVPMRAGQPAYLYTDGGQVDLRTSPLQHLTLDGPSVTSQRRMVVASVDLPVGTFAQEVVRPADGPPTAVLPRTGFRSRALSTRDETQFGDALFTGTGGRQVVVALLEPGDDLAEFDYALRSVRTITVPPVGPTDTVEVDLGGERPGQWVAARLDAAPADHRVDATLTVPPASGDWSLRIARLFQVTYDNGCNDCGSWEGGGYLGPGSHSYDLWFRAGTPARPVHLLLRVDEDTTADGTLTLRMP